MLQSLDNGRYTVLRALGRGGMGALFLATDHGAFGRTVVVKQLLDAPQGADEAERQSARARFVDEARTLAALRHPFIPKIFAYFADGPACFIVMEHIDGQNLDQGLSHADDAGQPVRGAPYPTADVARWGASLCGVLEYLHSRRPQPVLHQDIKPANLVLDQDSGALFLVDFGTAHAHSGAPTGGYGTPGYAPQEQYRGRSQPRSDVYALAATLYHLASDDDPSLHPFSFPQLDALGALGDALRPALAKDPAERPHAHDLRRALEALANSALAQALPAPDGDALYDERQLARWCERNWQRAAPWLRTRALPDELERRWGKPALARRLRDAVAQHPADDHAALDAALALLDPRGYGAVLPSLVVAPDVVEYTPRHGALRATTLTVHNQGRRYVRARLQAPPWLAVSVPVEAQAPGYSLRFPSLGLAPGQSATLALHGTPPPGALRSKVGEVLELREEDAGALATGALLASATLQGRLPPLKNLATPFALLLLAVLAPLALNLLTLKDARVIEMSTDSLNREWANGLAYPFPTADAGLSYPAPAATVTVISPAYPIDPNDLRPWREPPPAQSHVTVAEELYWAGHNALNAQRLDDARDALEKLHQSYPAYHNGDVLLSETYYQLALQAYGAKQWRVMYDSLTRLLELEPSYKDGEQLLKEALYRPGKIEFERGNYEKAHVALSEVWARDPSYLNTRLLLAQCDAHLADEALARNALDDAQRWLDELDQLHPNYPDLPRLRAALAAAQGRTPPAIP
jgi:serine/threonine protein kinase